MSSTTSNKATKTWPPRLRDIYDRADSMDAWGFADFFSPTGTMRFGNADALTGPQEIGESLTQFFGSIATMSHTLVSIWESPDRAIFEAVVTYGRHDGLQVDVPAVTAYRFDGDAVASCQVYCDLTPVFVAKEPTE